MRRDVRIETEKRNAESSQVAVVRLLDQRHRYATRSATTVADSVVANASVSNKVLSVQPESDPVIFHLLVLLVLREKFNPMRNNEKVLEFERLNVDTVN